MEGIFGVFSFDTLASQEVLDSMALSLGSLPKASFFLDGQLGLGIKRLPLVAETQITRPVCSNDSHLCVAINGEIHNFAELRHRLERRGYIFSSCSDAELIANLYRDKGEDFLKELNGLFVVAIWDRRDQEIILAQDRYGGIRQFYYALTNNAFIFSSSIRPILASSKVVPQVDESAFIEFFNIGHILPPHTMFKGVQKLFPGHVLRCRSRSVSTKSVYGFTFTPKLPANDASCLPEYYAESVKKRLIADRPVALLLSGGLDTSLNVAMASKLAYEPLTTLSVRFADQTLDESHYSRLVAKQYATNHHELTLDSSDALEDLPQIVWFQEEPLWDHSAVPSYHLARFAKTYVDAVIAGDGPDHLCGRYYQLAARRRFFRDIPGSRLLGKLLTKRLYTGFSRYYPVRAAQKLAQVANEPLEKCYKDIICSYHLWQAPCADPANRVLSEAIRHKDNVADYKNHLIPSYVTDDFNQLIVCDFIIEGSYGVFSKFGKVAAGQSLLVREPFFDDAVVDLINRLPDELKVRGYLWQRLRGTAERKHLLRRTLGQQLLPQEVLLKQKAGFTPPMGRWLKEKLLAVGANAVLSPSIKQACLFDTASVEILVREHLSNVKDNTLVLYMLLVFSLWHRLYIDKLTTECPTMKLGDILEG